MLIRVQGGSGGIAEYLEKGIKNGRDYTRDELDQRVILDGDLAITDQVIRDMERKDVNSQRYLHITLSFKEDSIPQEVMEDVVQDFKEFAMAAYEEDEYNFYAEAHLPKIKTITDKKTGEPVERKPHIHVVIPEKNLLTGQRLDPFGKVDHHKQFIDAFQEVTNEKYNLASPKVHVRQEITDESTLISRTKGDRFKGANHEVKEQVFADVLEKEINSTEQLASHLEGQGWSVKVRNEGKDSAYLNIKQPDAKRGINLKDSVFQSAFLELPVQEKQKALEPEATTYSTTHQDNYKAPEESHQQLAQWQQQRAHEVRLVSRRDRARYKNLSAPEKEQFLTTKREKIYGKYRISEPAEHPDHYLETAGKHLLNAERNRGGIEPGIRSITHRRTVRAVSAAIQRYYGYQAEPKPIQQRGRESDSLTQKTNALIETDNIATEHASMSVIQKRMDARALLTSLSQSHGVIPEKYTITQARDGSHRIRCGNHNLNVGDFLTKEIHLPWEEAREVLVKEDKRQQGRDLSLATEQDRNVFQHQWQPVLIKERKKAWGAQLREERQRRRQSFQQLRTEKNAIYGDSSLDRREKAVAVSVARMNKVIHDMQLARMSRSEREDLNVLYPKDFTHQWQQFEASGTQTESPMESITKTSTSQPAQKNHYLAVPYQEREEAKALGARWDKAQKSWFAPKGTDLAQLKQWLPENQAPKKASKDPYTEFQSALIDAGFQMDQKPVMDGKLHREKVEGDRGAEKSGAYIGYLDDHPAGMIQNWKTGLKTTWKSEGVTLTPEEKAQLQAEAAQKREAREQQRSQQQENVSAKCQSKWQNFNDKDLQSAYLERKQVDAHGLKQDHRGNLVVPLGDVDGKVWSLQTISPEGEKRFETGGKKSGCFHVVGDEKAISNHKTLLVAEGYATAASIHQATGQPVVMAFDSGNLSAVTSALHKKMPDQEIVIMGDDDHHREKEGKPNVGKEKAIEAAEKVGGRAVFPNFSEAEKAAKDTDFNDLHTSRGMDAFKRELQESLKIINQEHTQSMDNEQTQHQAMDDYNAYAAAKEGNFTPTATEQAEKAETQQQPTTKQEDTTRNQIGPANYQALQQETATPEQAQQPNQKAQQEPAPSHEQVVEPAQSTPEPEVSKQASQKEAPKQETVSTTPTITGELINHGSAPYENKKGNKSSYFVTVKTNNQEKTIWGADLERAMSKSSLQKGDSISLTMTGKKTVEVDVERKDSDGKVIRTDKVTTHRNEWLAEKAKAPENNQEQPKEVTIDNINKHLEASRLLIVYPQLKEQGFNLKDVEKTNEGQKIKQGDQSLSISEYLASKSLGSPEKIVKDLTPSYQAQIRDRERIKAYQAKQEKQKAVDINVEKSSSVEYGGKEKKKFEPLKPVQFEDVVYKTNDKGHVEYYVNKSRIVTDEGQRVSVNQTSDKGVEIGLRLSMEKFGKQLDVRGTEAYKKQIIMVAAREKLNISFTDSEMNKQLELKRSQMAKGENFIQAAEQKMINQRQDSQPQQQQTKQQEPARDRGPEMER